MNPDPRNFLHDLFSAAIAAAQPSICLPKFLPQPLSRRLVVIGAGKASAEMARVVEKHWQGELSGLVVTRYGHSVPCKKIEIVEAAHPVPDENGMNAAQRMLACVNNLDAEDTVLCLLSGGGSALLPLPLEGIRLADKQAIARALLKSGATIGEINCVRRHLSAIKGGRLAAACHPAQVISLLISDVPGDKPCDIASGPTVADASSCTEALAILQRHAIEIPAVVLELLESGRGESIKPHDPRLARASSNLIATPHMALKAAADLVRKAGITPIILGDSLEGEAREMARSLAGIVRSIAQHHEPFSAPCVLLSGGETTVTVRGEGRGGRNVEFLLALGIALEEQANVWAIAGDTDGIDGLEEIAGAVLTPDTLSRAWHLGINPRDALEANDGHGFFGKLGDAVITGPTLTNVNDFRAILILPHSASA